MRLNVTVRFAVVGMILIVLLGVHPDTRAESTNSWIALGGGKWETNSNWSLGTPSINNGIVVVSSPPSLASTIIIDGLTAGSFPGSMTISNLLVERGGGLMHPSTRLSLTNAGTVTPLSILDTLTITSGGTVSITNSALLVRGLVYGVYDDGFLELDSGMLTCTNAYVYVGYTGFGQMTVNNGLCQGGYVSVGELTGASGTLTVAGGTTTVGSLLYVGDSSAGTGAVWLTGGQLVASNVDSDVEIGRTGAGQLTVSNGLCLGYFVSVGGIAGSSGTLTLDGGTTTVFSLTIGTFAGATGTVWLTGGQLDFYSATGETIVGAFGIGQMTVSNGTWLAGVVGVGVDAGSQGTLTVAGGATSASSGLDAGYYAGSTGSVWLTGGQVLATNNNTEATEIGYSGVGQMTVSNGTWLADLVSVARQPGSQGALTQSGGLVHVYSETLGYSNSVGTLTVAGGTHIVGAGGLTIANDLLATGVVWLAGGQLLATNYNTEVTEIGYSGVGQMTVSNGTWLADLVGVAGQPGSQGALTVAGGTNVFSQELVISAGNNATGAVWISGGQLVVTNGGSGVFLGVDGVGTMTVSNGVWQALHAVVGADLGGTATLTAAGGTSTVSSNLTIGTPDCLVGGTLVVDGGNVFVTNAAHNAVLDLERGTLTLSAGTLVVDTLVNTNPCGLFRFQQTGGTLIVGGVTNTFFHVTAIGREGDNIRITWQTNGGETNILQATDGMAGSYATNFTDLSLPIILPGSGNVTTNYLDVGGATNFPARFYRVRLVP